MPEDSKFALFLSHRAKHEGEVRPPADRLWQDESKVRFDESEIKPDDNGPAKIQERLNHLRMLVLCMSANRVDLGAMEADTCGAQLVEGATLHSAARRP